MMIRLSFWIQNAQKFRKLSKRRRRIKENNLNKVLRLIKRRLKSLLDLRKEEVQVFTRDFLRNSLSELKIAKNLKKLIGMNFQSKASELEPKSIVDPSQSQFSGWMKPNLSKALKVPIPSQIDFFEKHLKENRSEKMNLTIIEDLHFWGHLPLKIQNE